MFNGYVKAATTGISLAMAVALGLSVSIKSWDGMVYFYTSDNSRSPAAIRRGFDFSHLDGVALTMASQERIMDEARVLLRDKEMGVELGHFVVRDRSGAKEFACQAFDRIELVFHAAELAVSGEPTRMTVQGPCRVGKDINRIDPLWVPVRKVLEEKSGNVELQYLEEAPVTLGFQNMGGEWPLKWNLEQVRLYNSADSTMQLIVDRHQIHKLSKNPVIMNWTTLAKHKSQTQDPRGL